MRLRPLRGADIMDIVLAGKTATIESIVQDYFFFSPFEIEPLAGEGSER